MNSKTTISISEARKKIFDIAEEVQRPGAFYTLTENGRPKVVIMSADEFDSWAETLEVIKDFPDLKKDIEETSRAVKTGEYKNWTTLDQILAKEGYVLADKSKKKYEVRSKIKTGRRKSLKKNP